MPDMRFIDELISKHLQQNISEAETIELNKWIAESQENKALFEKLTDARYISDELDKFYQYDELKGWDKVKGLYQFVNETEPPATQGKLFRIRNWRKFVAVAASILLIVSTGWYFIAHKTNNPIPTAEVAHVHDVQPPSTNRATVTLANGQVIYLDSVKNGILAQQGNISMQKLADGKIAYAPIASSRSTDNSTNLVYNTLTNPRGSKVIDMTLSDGSKVWLNAGSSVTFPVAFAENERKVTITGEAYFEVSKDANKHFLVDANGVTTEVLGTHFNINSYSDEATTKITLLEGSVKVTKGNATGLLKPGQQAQVAADVQIVNDINTEEVMAWKEGKFQFGEKADIPSVMRQIARWYDVEVAYKGTVSGHIGGGISRDVNASQVLKMLEATGVAKFTIEGQKVIVSPQ